MSAGRKLRARLKRRRDAYDDRLATVSGYRRPGSLNAHKPAPKGRR